MYRLPCPNCQSVILVSPSQAGDQTTCPACGQIAAIPKLGELRELPQDSSTEAGIDSGHTPPEGGMVQRIGFIALGLIATASLLIAGYCGIRWALVDIPYTTETHLTGMQEMYPKLLAAELLREYEQMEKAGLELPYPYPYKKLQNEKDHWGLIAMIASGVGIFSILGAIIFAVSGNRASAKT